MSDSSPLNHRPVSFGGREYFELELDDGSVVVVFREIGTGQWFMLPSSDEAAAELSSEAPSVDHPDSERSRA